MTSIVLKTLSVLLGLFFIFVGIMKITPKLNKSMHTDIQKSFIQYAKVFPFAKTFGFKVPSKWFRRTVGFLEAVSGFALVFLPGYFKEFANLVLLILMMGAAYSHHAIGDKFERMAPAIVFTFMLTCRLVVYLQVRCKDARDRKAALTASIPANTAAAISAAVNHHNKEVKQD